MADQNLNTNVPPPPPGFVPINSAPSPSSSSSIPPPPAGFTPVDSGSNPYPIADSDKGAVAQTLKTGEGLLKLPGHIIDAFSNPPQDDDEKIAEGTGGRVNLALWRLISKPMQKSGEIADAYQKIADDKKQQRTTPQDHSVAGKLKRLIVGDDDADVRHAVDMAQAHRLASIVPLLGPAAADIVEHFNQGDPSGAVASLLSQVAAGKVLDSATKGVARQISKVGPKMAIVAGESTPVMAGQLKDAAPIAEEVAKTPSREIAEQQQAAAQQGVKNIATDAANKTLKKFGQSTDEADSFGAAGEKVRQAAQPVYQKLDKLSDGMFATFQHKMAAATKVMRRATSMEDLESAETHFDEAQKGIDDLFKHHADEIGPEDLENAKSAWRDQAVLKKVHTYVESAFSAPEDIADSSSTVTRTLRGNSLRPRLNQMLKKVPAGDLNRVLGPDGVRQLFEVAKLTEKPEGLSEMQSMIGKIASDGYISKVVKSPAEARNLVARYLATSPRVSHMMINALKFGTPAKVYGPMIANAITLEQPQDDQGNK
jgi:hypothetical protein